MTGSAPLSYSGSIHAGAMKLVVYAFVLTFVTVLVPVGFLCELSVSMTALLRRYRRG